MGTSALLDMYARSPRTAGPGAKGIHIRQNSPHVITNTINDESLAGVAKGWQYHIEINLAA